MKVSYSSMPNMARIISGHNRKVTGSSTHMETNDCNCRSQSCPPEGKTTNLFIRSTVEATGTPKELIELTSNTFKDRFTVYKASFTHHKHAHKTTLSSHIWELKDEQTTYNQH